MKNNIISIRKRAAAISCVVMASLSLGDPALAQAFPPSIELPANLPTAMPAMPLGGYPATVAPTVSAPYYAPPAWSQTLAPNVRFVILSNFSSDAVLDRETGLVWTRRSVMEVPNTAANRACQLLALGNRLGWRLPTVAELQSLVDLTVANGTTAGRLPPGHPFVLTLGGNARTHWASDFLIQGSTSYVFRSFVNMNSGLTDAQLLGSTTSAAVLCVRGFDTAGKMDQH